MRIALFLFSGALACPLAIAGAFSSQQEGLSAPAQTNISGAAAATPTLTLADAITQALQHNPTLRSASLDVGIADAAKLQAGAMPNPELGILREGMNKGTRTQTVQVSQVLELGGKRSARVQLAEQDLHVAQADFDITKAQLRSDVTVAYFDALTGQQRVELARASLQLAQRASQAASRRVAAGRISPVEESRSRVAEAAAQMELAQAQSEAQLSMQRLVVFLGEKTLAPRNLIEPDDTSGPVLPLEVLRERLEQTPQLRKAREQTSRADALVSLERRQRIPNLTVTLGNKREDETGRNQAVVGLSIPLPLWNRNQGNLLSALRQADKARVEQEAEQIRLQAALTEVYQRLQVASAELGTLRTTVLPSAQSAYDAAVIGFEAGKFNFLDVLDAQRTLFQAREQLLRALSARYRAAAELERYTAPDAGRNH